MNPKRMKKILYLLSVLMLLAQVSLAQINVNKVLKKSTKKAERNVENRIGKHIDKGVDKTLDKTEESIGEAAKEAAKEGEEKEEGNTSATDNTNATDKTAEEQTGSESPSAKGETGMKEQLSRAPTLSWAKYDFVPGTEIIFEDDFMGEKNGEFPSRWDITKGVVEMAELGTDMVVYFRKTNANAPDAIMPLLTNRTEDYLPEEFTVEFDAWFNGVTAENATYHLFLYDAKNQQKVMTPSKPIKIEFNHLEYNQMGDKYPGQNVLKPVAGWRHVAVSFNKRALKGYLDDTRLLNVPNCDFNPTGVMLTAHNTSGTKKAYIKNVRIAKGAVPLYDKFLVDGKFVTTGIKFDVNKASIRPESMGTINYVVQMMKDHPELKFSVEGHTDSDGDNALNQKLSEARAKAIRDKMISLGIAAERLSSKGWGESKPMTGNESPEGKAQNRRVEFVKI